MAIRGWMQSAAATTKWDAIYGDLFGISVHFAQFRDRVSCIEFT